MTACGSKVFNFAPNLKSLSAADDTRSD